MASTTPGLLPEEAARALRQEEGFVFLDSSLASAESLSLLASKPSLVLEAHMASWGTAGAPASCSRHCWTLKYLVKFTAEAPERFGRLLRAPASR